MLIMVTSRSLNKYVCLRIYVYKNFILIFNLVRTDFSVLTTTRLVCTIFKKTVYKLC